ncbi:sensor histidine kinase [Parablastomonas sp. CN1-191]|uniref:sensor histidine kinase n=1 Tax=Parablastomonas sp. CN1-191 TaxID=3400908 RepID=UPI003BF789C5
MTLHPRSLHPRSLQGQLMLGIALAVLLAQGISAALIWRSQAERREAALVHAAAVRLAGTPLADGGAGGHGPRMGPHGRVQIRPDTPILPGESRVADEEAELRRILSGQIDVGDVVVVHRPASQDPETARRFAAGTNVLGQPRRMPAEVIVAAIERPEGGWLVTRILAPRADRMLLLTFGAQTLLLYALLLGAIALVVRRVTGPLAALTRRVEAFGDTRNAQARLAPPLAPQGPDDVRRLIAAQGAMEHRVAALLDEKDVMLGAIGHDLKTPLAALRVRIESVEDDAERARMAATIEDITRTLDDILSLARVGRPSDPREPTELAALVAQVCEEYEDMGEPVTLEETQRIVAPIRATWLRRALRNLVSNSVRYAGGARVALVRDGGEAAITVADDGPGIPKERIEGMMEPFTRGDPSRNSETGGAGLGLTLARAIAEQHGGTLTLANRRGADGAIAGLTATLRLPV